MKARLSVQVAAVMVAVVVGGCGQTFLENLVTGKFDGGKLIALNWWIGTNTNSVGIRIDAYADLADQTPGTLDIKGPQHWRCTGAFSTPKYIPSTGGFLESDQDRIRDKVVSLPKLAMGFAGPPGTYRVTIALQSPAVEFGHTWKFGGPEFALGSGSAVIDVGRDPLAVLYDNSSTCTQTADTIAQQKSIADLYLSALRDRLDRASPSPIRNQLQGLLDQARQAKISGDGQANSDERSNDYQSAAAILTKVVQLAGASIPSWDGSRWLPLSPADVEDIRRKATTAAALLLQTGLR